MNTQINNKEFIEGERYFGDSFESIKTQIQKTNFTKSNSNNSNLNFNNSNSINTNNSNSSTIINVIKSKDKFKRVKNIDNKSVRVCMSELKLDEKQHHFPSINSRLFLQNSDFVYVPTKAICLVTKRLSNSKLKKIHIDKSTAIDLIMIMLSFVSETNFIDSGMEVYKKNLSSKYLQKTFQRASNYKEIINILQKEFKTGALIECDFKSIKGVKSYSFNLGENYVRKGLVKYKLKSQLGKEIYERYLNQIINLNSDNPIVKNMFSVYKKLRLPTIEEIIQNGKLLISQGYENKKGYKLSFENKNRSRDIQNNRTKCYVEDVILRFNYLIEGGFRIPIVGAENTGGRVYDSFTLMDSWIRKMIKIDDEEIVECDYSCLHPNIAISMFGGNQKYLTHELIAYELKSDLKSIKTEHLSFFNKPLVKEQNGNHFTGGMNDSLLFDYYIKNEPTMMENLISDKNKEGYKATTYKMLKKEVEIMTSVVIKLNSYGVHVLYVFDALYCKKSDKAKVVSIMNEEILKHGVYTCVKIEGGR